MVCFQTSLKLPKGRCKTIFMFLMLAVCLRVSFVEKWPLMNPTDVGFILIAYLLFVQKIGPLIMERCNPIRIRGLLVIYNIIKVINSSVLAYKFACYIADKGLFPRACQYDDNTVYAIAVLYWKYMATKILDLFDTAFFVIRKKHNQVTFLHVYHHVFMVVITWACLKYDPSDHWAFMAVMNCSIHTCMYTYYGIAALGPKFAMYLWWKKYLTVMQMIQFVLVIVHVMTQTYTSYCPMHAGSYWIGLSNLTLFICLFTDFYNKRYRSRSRGRECREVVEFACTKQD